MARRPHLGWLPLALVSATVQGQSIRDVVFRTLPRVTKLEIRRYLESVYGIQVDRVNTANYEGKKKKFGNQFFYRKDYKKAYVRLRNPIPAGNLPFTASQAGSASDKE